MIYTKFSHVIFKLNQREMVYYKAIFEPSQKKNNKKKLQQSGLFYP